MKHLLFVISMCVSHWFGIHCCDKYLIKKKTDTSFFFSHLVRWTEFFVLFSADNLGSGSHDRRESSSPGPSEPPGSSLDQVLLKQSFCNVYFPMCIKKQKQWTCLQLLRPLACFSVLLQQETTASPVTPALTCSQDGQLEKTILNTITCQCLCTDLQGDAY